MIRLRYTIPSKNILHIKQKINKERNKYEEYLTVQEMAKNLNCSEGRIRYAIKNNKIKHYKLHNKMYRVHINDFQNYIQEHIEEVQDCLILQESAYRLNMSKASLE